MFALWRERAAREIAAEIARGDGEPAPRDGAARRGPRFLRAATATTPFANLNGPEDFAAAEARLGLIASKEAGVVADACIAFGDLQFGLDSHFALRFVSALELEIDIETESRPSISAAETGARHN